MKLLSTFETFSAITANSEDANFPIENVQDADPFLRWHAGQYSVDESVVIDLGAATSVDSVFLNQCNFPAATIQGNATDSWGSPSFSQAVTLPLDDADNRKGFFTLTAFNYRYMRILIASGQTLDNSEAAPAIGNIIMGTAATMPKVFRFEPRLVKAFDDFTNDNGSFSQTAKDGRSYHVISVSCGDTWAAIRALSKTWTIGVFFADLGYADEAYLVYPPKEWTPPDRNPLDATISFTMREKP